MVGDDRSTYERPLVEPDNRMTGGFQSGRFDASPQASTGRSAARWSLLLGALWIAGLGSLVALLLSVLALASGDIGTAHRRMAMAGAVLAVAGLAATVVIFTG